MYASVWKRFFAFLIDAAIFAVLFWILSQMLSGASVALVLLVIIWLYYAMLESSPLQASVGKMIMNIKVVDRKGRRLTFWQSTERILSKLITNITFYFGFFIAAFDKKKRTLHDRVSHSAVISNNADFDPEAEPAEEEEEASLTLITVVSILLALAFVVMMLGLVALPQYQRTERHIQLSRVLTGLEQAAREQQKANIFLGKTQTEWQGEFNGCTKINPQKLSCKGYELVLEPDGVTAQARSGGMDILYSLYYSFNGGPVTCEADTAPGHEICSVFDNN